MCAIEDNVLLAGSSRTGGLASSSHQLSQSTVPTRRRKDLRLSNVGEPEAARAQWGKMDPSLNFSGGLSLMIAWLTDTVYGSYSTELSYVESKKHYIAFSVCKSIDYKMKVLC